MSAARKSLPSNWCESPRVIRHTRKYPDSAATYLSRGSPQIGNDSALHRVLYGAIHGIVSDAKSVAEHYHWEDGHCWSFDHQSVTQGTLVRLSNV
jgi:hypothetical protein